MPRSPLLLPPLRPLLLQTLAKVKANLRRLTQRHIHATGIATAPTALPAATPVTGDAAGVLPATPVDAQVPPLPPANDGVTDAGTRASRSRSWFEQARNTPRGSRAAAGVEAAAEATTLGNSTPPSEVEKAGIGTSLLRSALGGEPSATPLASATRAASGDSSPSPPPPQPAPTPSSRRGSAFANLFRRNSPALDLTAPGAVAAGSAGAHAGAGGAAVPQGTVVAADVAGLDEAPSYGTVHVRVC